MNINLCVSSKPGCFIFDNEVYYVKRVTFITKEIVEMFEVLGYSGMDNLIGFYNIELIRCSVTDTPSSIVSHQTHIINILAKEISLQDNKLHSMLVIVA